MIDFYSLWTLEIPVYDFVVVQVLHARRDLLGPVHQSAGWDAVFAVSEII